MVLAGYPRLISLPGGPPMRFVVVLMAMVLVCAGGQVSAATESEFFAGKTVTILIGFGPGGENDAWARVISKHLATHLPGHPRIVPQNSPGAGGLKLMNELYTVLPKDGTTIGLVNRGIPLEPLLQGEGTRFDPSKMNWIGSPDKDTTVCAARKDSRVQTMRDLF